MDQNEAYWEASPSSEPTVFASTRRCLALFNTVLQQASLYHARELSMVESFHARLSTWAVTMGVFRSEQKSMDDQLRIAPDASKVVKGLLESLSYRILTCSEILGNMLNDTTSEDMDAQKSRLDRIFTHIGTEISHLSKVSDTISRGSREKQMQQARDFRITDDQGNDLEPTLSDQFRSLIRENFSLIREDVELKGDSELEQRLLRSMVLRWKHVLYLRHREGFNTIQAGQAWSDISAHDSELDERRLHPKIDDSEYVYPAAPTTSPSASGSKETTLDSSKHAKRPPDLSYIADRMTFDSPSHEALIFPEAPVSIKKQEPEERLQMSNPDNEERVRSGNPMVASVSKLEESMKTSFEEAGNVTCPYCLHALPADFVFIKQNWENHVSNDLNPYICLFKGCSQPDMLFHTSEEWLSHMNQHAKTWKCSSDHEPHQFSSRKAYMQHMRETHMVTLSDNQLRTMASLNARNSRPLLQTCPLCGKKASEATKTLESHITGHLRYLALRSLPGHEERITVTTLAQQDDRTGATLKIPSRRTRRQYPRYGDVFLRTRKNLAAAIIQTARQEAEKEDFKRVKELNIVALSLALESINDVTNLSPKDEIKVMLACCGALIKQAAPGTKRHACVLRALVCARSEIGNHTATVDLEKIRTAGIEAWNMFAVDVRDEKADHGIYESIHSRIQVYQASAEHQDSSDYKDVLRLEEQLIRARWRRRLAQERWKKVLTIVREHARQIIAVRRRGTVKKANLPVQTQLIGQTERFSGKKIWNWMKRKEPTRRDAGSSGTTNDETLSPNPMLDIYIGDTSVVQDRLGSGVGQKKQSY